jgi:CheY-like chemotaxis protein
VDDDELSRFALRALLESDGWTVAESADGEAAMQLLRDGLRPAAILLDLMMPETNGWAFRRQQIADAELSKIPVIILSGMNDPPGLIGTAAFVRKPIDNARFLATVRRVASNSIAHAV